MKLNKSSNALFIYSQDESGNFWVFDGHVFHRFLWNSEGLWFIRSQSYLPPYSFGKCLALTVEQRQLLEEEAFRHHISLPFFSSESDCNHFAVSSQKNQFVFDCTFPSGYFLMLEKR